MIDRALVLNALLADPAKAAQIGQEEATALLIALAPVREALRLAASAAPRTAMELEPTPAAEPRMLTLKEVAERSGKSLRWWRQHWWTEIPTAKKAGKTVHVPEEDYAKWRRK